MRQRRPLLAEVLEVRSLLSAISYSLTATPASASPGQAVVFTFTESNTSDQAVTVDVRPADFGVSQGGSLIWQSDAVGASPPISSETLQPGQSVQQTASWDGLYTETFNGTPTFSYNVFGGFTVTNLNDSHDAVASFQIADPITQAVITDQSVYQLGQPITATYTEVNTASVPISILNPVPRELSLYYADGTPLYWQAWPQWVTNDPTTLDPGQVVTETQTFNLVPSFGPNTYAKLTGNFFAGFGPETGPVVDSAPFQVVAPTGIVSSVTADQTSIALGQTVNLTFTETNSGTQAVPVLEGASDFEISAGGTAVWYSSLPAFMQPTWVSLQPGQSYSQTASWSGQINSGLQIAPTTNLSVTNLLDPGGNSVLLQLSSPISSPGAPWSSSPTPTPTPTPAPAPGASAISATLLADQHRYEIGHTVRLTLVLKNQSAAKVSLKPGAGLDRITVLDGSTVVYQGNELRARLTARSIKPREKTTLAVAWSGRANQGGITKLCAGTYTIEVMEDGYVGTTSVRLVR